MALMTASRRGGDSWTQTFADAIDPEKCIGCARCYKACAHKVLEPHEDIDEESDTVRMIMTIANKDNCVGCAACGVACPKKCFSFTTVEV